MAYNAVSQADHELASDSDDSRGPSPQPQPRPGSMISAITASYVVVENDDYEVVDPHPTRPAPNSASFSPRAADAPPDRTEQQRTTTEISIPLSHPTPGLQSLQGAYLHNVERLEKTAERLSLSSADIGSEIRKMDLEQRRRSSSTSNHTNSQSPQDGTVVSRRGSLQSVTRLAQLSEQQAFEDLPEHLETRVLEHHASGDGREPSVAQHAIPSSLPPSLISAATYHTETNEVGPEQGPHAVRSYLPTPPKPTAAYPTDKNMVGVEREQPVIQPHIASPPESAIYHTKMNEIGLTEVKGAGAERPPSAASGDTYLQARSLFTDFDGVHYDPNGSRRRLSLTRPPLASRPESYKQPQEGENMVFYPAPVPMMLNLPPRLSQRPDQREREKRRTQLLDVVVPENRKSAPWLSDQDQSDRRRTKQPSELPPQLRASVFFEPPSTSLDIEPTQTSAVATLDSILDASTTAPVTAFTDHPFAGPLGAEVYGSSKHGKLSKDVSGPRGKQRPKSTLAPRHQPSGLNSRSGSLLAEGRETTSLPRSNSDTEDDSEEGSESGEEDYDDDEEEEEEEEDDDDDDDDDEDDEIQITGPPATLLAELEQRKHDLKHRRRTAANAVGLHSTLLQLEAVAAKQSEHRRQKPVALAWENTDAHNDEDEDEDVPLGMLYPDGAQAAQEARPVGLMEKREMEETEPLSRRRARLRGEPLPQPPEQRPVTMYSHAAQGPLDQAQEDDSGDEEETLAQRSRRLKDHQRSISKADTDFTTEIMAEFDNLKDDGTKDNQDEPSQEDETLAQRRARLKKEADAKRNSGLKIPRYRRSMADVLSARTPETAGQQSLHQEDPNPGGLVHQLNNRVSMQQLPANAGPPKTAAGPPHHQTPSMAGPYGFGMAHPNTFYSDAILNNGHLSYAMPNNFNPNALRDVIDPGQREIIDRWRQSIV
ncbi:uncharacterized protein BJX67DRAFT_130168 [Aspergillus lucknowensis]|uniref:Uncharacterized protein n=1 Tax=Aspergillus lucknowensis TaxID=176173 RepID=A0ABR4LPT7_9EURO